MTLAKILNICFCALVFSFVSGNNNSIYLSVNSRIKGVKYKQMFRIVPDTFWHGRSVY